LTTKPVLLDIKVKPAYIGITGAIVQPIFMHNPIGFLSMWGSAFVEDKSLSHSNPLASAVYHLVTASSLPKPSSSCPIGARTSWIFLVLVAKEVPIILWGGSYFASLCKKPIESTLTSLRNTSNIINLKRM
jgi:hypothetical protein